MKKLLITCALLAAPISLQGAIVITEFSYQGADALETEFIEFTNIGTTAVDMTGWSFDDDSATAGTVDLSAFQLVQPGQSVILTDAADVESFRTIWNLDSSVVIIAGNSAGLGRNDTINLFNAEGVLADRLVYGDQDIAGSVRPRQSGFTTDPAYYGMGLTDDNAILNWYASSTDDGISFASAASPTEIGSPGVAVIPETSTLLLGLIGSLGMLRRRR